MASLLSAYIKFQHLPISIQINMMTQKCFICHRDTNTQNGSLVYPRPTQKKLQFVLPPLLKRLSDNHVLKQLFFYVNSYGYQGLTNEMH